MGIEGLIKRIPQTVDYASQKSEFPNGVRVIDCSLGSSPFGYPSEVDQVLTQINSQLINEYPRDPFAKELGENVRTRFGLKSSTEVFFGGAGSYGLLASVLSDFINLNGRSKSFRVIGAGPQFTNIAMLCNRAGIPYEPVVVGIDKPYSEKIDHLTKLRSESSEPAVVYVDNPNNPTGDAVGVDQLARLVEVTKDRDLLIIDEAYGDAISDNDSAFKLTEDCDNLLVLRSVSKTVGLASSRLGYMVMSGKLAENYKKIELIFSVDHVTQIIAKAAMNPKVLSRFLPQVRDKTIEVKNVLIAKLNNLNIDVMPTQPTVSILLARGNGNFFQSLVAVGISTEDGATFKPTHPEMDSRYVRFRIPGNREVVEEVGKRIKLIIGKDRGTQ